MLFRTRDLLVRQRSKRILRDVLDAGTAPVISGCTRQIGRGEGRVAKQINSGRGRWHARRIR